MNPWTKFVAAGGFAKASNLESFIDVVVWLLSTWFIVGGAGALIIAILLFVILHAAYQKKALLTGAPNGTPLRAPWMWDNSNVPKTASSYITSQVVAKPAPYLAWAKSNGIVETWLNPIEVLDMPVEVGEFLGLAKQQGMSTQFLFAATPTAAYDPSGTDTGGVKELADVLKLIEKLDADVWPTGVQSNLEGQFTAAGGDQLALNVAAAAYLQAHVDFKTKLDDFNQTHASNLRLVASVFYSWLKFEAEGQAPQVNGTDYGMALLKLGVDVTVQDYRDPPSWGIAPAQKWCEVASSLGRRAWIGLLVGPGKTGGGVHAYKDDIWNLDGDLTKVATKCINQPGFSGVAVHDTYWYHSAAPA